MPKAPFALPPSSAETEANMADYSKATVADINVSAEESEENLENNSVMVRAELLPSRNKPPRVAVISPKNGVVLIKPLNGTLEVPLRINASDPDGKVVKVRVLEQNFQIIIEDNQYKFVFGGKKYTAQEAEAAGEALARYFGGDASRNDDGTFNYVWKSLRYGTNRVSIETTDDGGRFGFTQLEVEVKSDATVRVVTPKNEQVITPGTSLTIETTSRISNGITPLIRLLGTQAGFPESYDQLPLMRQISKTGDTYKHQFVWRIEKEGVYDLRPIVLENGQDTNTTDSVRIIAAYPRVITFPFIKNGQIFEADKPVKVQAAALDTKGEIVRDGLELLVDGNKIFGELSNSWTTEPTPPYKKYIDPQGGVLLSNLEKGTHTLQVIARQYSWSADGATLGKSEIITIVVK